MNKDNDLHYVYATHEYGDKLCEILGLKSVKSVDIHFNCDEPVTADVTFLLNNVQVKAILNLCESGWHSPLIGADPKNWRKTSDPEEMRDLLREVINR